MSPEQFCYWLQGAFELQPEGVQFSKEQQLMIKQHLDTVFVKGIVALNDVELLTFDNVPSYSC